VHQATGGVIHEDQNTAFWGSAFEPVMVRAIDLNQLAETVATIARLETGFAGGNEDARDRRLSSSYGWFQRRDKYDGVQPVFRLRALGQNLNSGTGSNPGLYSVFLHRSGCLQDVHGGKMQMRLLHLSGTDAQDAPDEH
jgi:hypothetical protein